MQYSQMINLMEKAKQAGYSETEPVNYALAQAFESWIGDQRHLGDLTEEEEDVLREAFEEGYGICIHKK